MFNYKEASWNTSFLDFRGKRSVFLALFASVSSRRTAPYSSMNDIKSIWISSCFCAIPGPPLPSPIPHHSLKATSSIRLFTPALSLVAFILFPSSTPNPYPCPWNLVAYSMYLLTFLTGCQEFLRGDDPAVCFFWFPKISGIISFKS